MTGLTFILQILGMNTKFDTLITPELRTNTLSILENVHRCPGKIEDYTNTTSQESERRQEVSMDSVMVLKTNKLTKMTMTCRNLETLGRIDQTRSIFFLRL